MMAPVSAATSPARDHRWLSWFETMSYIPLLDCAGLNCKAVCQDMGARGAAYSVPLIWQNREKDLEACVRLDCGFFIGDSLRNYSAQQCRLLILIWVLAVDC